MGNKASTEPPKSRYNFQEAIPPVRPPPGLSEFESRDDTARICATISGEIINSRYIINNPGFYDKNVLLYVFDADHNLIHGEIFEKEKINDSSLLTRYGFANGEKLIPFKYISACKIHDKDLEERPDTNTHHTTKPELGIMCDPKPGPKWEDILYNPKKYDGKVLVYGKHPFKSELLIQRFSSINMYYDMGYNFSGAFHVLDSELHFCYPSNNQVNLHIDDPVSFIPGQRTGQCLFNAYETILFYADVIRHLVLDELQIWLTYKELLALPETPVKKETHLTQFVKRSYPHADPYQLSFFEQIFFRYIFRQLLQYDIPTLQIIAPPVKSSQSPSLLARKNSIVATPSIEKISITTLERIVAQTATNHNLYGTNVKTLDDCKLYQDYRSFTIIEPLFVPHISVFSGNSLNKFHFNKIKSTILAFHISLYNATGPGHAIAIVKNNGEWYLCEGNIGLAKRIARENVDLMLESLAVYYEDEPPHEFQMVVESEATLYQLSVEGRPPTLLYRHGAKVHDGNIGIYRILESKYIKIFVDARAIGSEANIAFAASKNAAKAKLQEAAATAAAKQSAISMAVGWLGPRIGGNRRRSQRQRTKKRRSTRK